MINSSWLLRYVEFKYYTALIFLFVMFPGYEGFIKDIGWKLKCILKDKVFLYPGSEHQWLRAPIQNRIVEILKLDKSGKHPQAQSCFEHECVSLPVIWPVVSTGKSTWPGNWEKYLIWYKMWGCTAEAVIFFCGDWDDHWELQSYTVQSPRPLQVLDSEHWH